MPNDMRELKALLAADYRFHRHGKGDHETWWSPVSRRSFTVDNEVKSRHAANETLKQAGLPKAF